MSVPRSAGFAMLTALLLAIGGELAAQQSLTFDGTLSESASASTTSRATHSFPIAAGHRVKVRLTSDDFDPVLHLISPQGDSLENDDFEGDTNSQILTYASEAGTWRAVVTAFGDEPGDYRLEVALTAVGNTRELPPGELTESDSISAKGFHYDGYSLTLTNPAQLFVEMTSADFAPQVILMSPRGNRFASASGSTGASIAALEVPVADAGTWRLWATHADPDGGLGKFSIRVSESSPTTNREVIAGSLSAGDARQIQGEFYDTHIVGVVAARPLVLTLAGDTFDAYLAARSPSGKWYRDDDGAGSSDARLELPAEAGDWLVIVTSFGPGETGEYELVILR